MHVPRRRDREPIEDPSSGFFLSSFQIHYGVKECLGVLRLKCCINDQADDTDRLVKTRQAGGCRMKPGDGLAAGGRRNPCDVEALAARSDGAFQAGAPWERRADAVAATPTSGGTCPPQSGG